MSTPSRAEINEANSQHSTGPKSEEGKRRSSQNALRHGLTSTKIVVMPTEDPAACELHVQSFTTECAPKGPIESHLVQALADLSWRLNRVAAIATKLLDEAASPEILAKTLASMSMHSHRLSGHSRPAP